MCAKIVLAYPKQTDLLVSQNAVLKSLRKGEFTGEEILTRVQALAAVIQKLPSGGRNGFVPWAGRFFLEEKWRDDPATWEALQQRRAVGITGAFAAEGVVVGSPAID